jgi:vancomycin resistance protein VanW
MNWEFAPLSMPKRRSRLRMKVGREWHITRRHLRWWFSRERLARLRSEHDLEHEVFAHRTPLIRSLPSVDLWLQENKIENLRIAIGRINGLRIQPGETFSFWQTVGRPTAGKGYKLGFALEQGKVTHSIGGGLCQLTNMLFWTALHSPLIIAERWRHSFDVFPDVARTQPFGSGATCSFNYLDLCLRNSTRATFAIRLWIDEGYLNIVMTSDEKPLFSYEITELDHVIRQEAFGGYSRHNRIQKSVFLSESGELIDAYVVVENHALMMYSPLLSQYT